MAGAYVKNESYKDIVKRMTLACIVLHIICIDINNETPRNWDINYDSHLERRPREEVVQLLVLTDCHPSRETSTQAAKVRDALCCKFWAEHEMGK